MKLGIKGLRTQAVNLAGTRWSEGALFLCALADASFLPVPTSTFFVILIMMNGAKSLRYIIFGTLGTLAGALLAFSVGHFAWLNAGGEVTGLGNFLLHHIPGFSHNSYDKLQTIYSGWDFWILFSAAFTPIPYGIIAISAGVFNISLVIFIIATAAGQALKFFLMAFVSTRIGPKVKLLQGLNLKPLALITSLFIILAIAIH
jgi:membrane protein YqaA with SNARE-associated domain